MTSLRPDEAFPGTAPASAHTATRNVRPSGRNMPGSALTKGAATFTMAFATLCVLTACSGDQSLSIPVPPHPNIPAVAHDNYPNVGTTESTGRAPLAPPQRARLEADIARSGNQQWQQVVTRIESESATNAKTSPEN